MNAQNAADSEAAIARRLSVVMRDLLARDAFDSLADLLDAVKAACGQLRLSWTNEALDQALWLTTNRLPPSPMPQQGSHAGTPDVSPLTHAQSVELLHRYGVDRCGRSTRRL